MKICTICEQELDLSCFTRDRQKKDGLRSSCKTCSEKKHKEGRDRPERKAKISSYHKTYYKENRERARAYQTANRDRRSAYMKEWRTEKKEKIVAYKRHYEKKRLAEDPQYKLIKTLRNRILAALKGGAKHTSTIDLLGCSLSTLKTHLENQFQPGMTWANHSRKGWHIDHILPCASFDLSTIEGQRRCFHYTNMQPLWATDNCRKGDRIGAS